MAVKSAALLLLLPLLQEVGADWTTTVHTTLIVPNTVTPVVKFVTPPATPLSSTPSSLPLTYDHANSHKLKLTSVASPLEQMEAQEEQHPPSVTTSPGPANSGASSATPNESGSSAAEGTPGNPPTSSAGVPPGGHSSSKPLVPNGSTASGSHSKHTTTQPAVPDTTKSGSPAGTSGGSSKSGSPDGPASSQPNNTGTKGSNTSSSKPVGPSGSTTPGSPPKHTTTQPASPDTTKSGSPAGTSGGSSKSGSPDGPASSQPNNTGTKGSDTSSSKSVGPSGSTPNPPGGTTSSTPKGPASDATATKSTSPSDGASGTPDHSTTGHPSSLPTVNPSNRVSSVDLASATDLQSAATSNSDIADFAPSASPSQEEWASMPATTTSGSPASISSDSAIIALMLRNSYNNIDEFKKDPKTYKKHIEDIEDQTSKYLSKTGFDTGKSPCSGSKKRSSIEKRGLFDAVASIAKSAVSATVNTASDIANSALSCVAPIVDDIKNVIPDDVDVKDITPEIEDQVKKGTEYLDEISNIVDNMDEKKNDDDDHTSSSKSDSSTTTSSTTGTCTLSTTYSDCTWDTIVTPVANSDTTTISVITSTQSCTTRTGCDEKPSTFETTSTVDACSFVSVQEAPGVGVAATSFSVSATPGAGVSGGSSATAHSTASPGSTPKTTGSSSTTKSSVTTTTSAGPTCSANHVVDNKDGWEYCEFECTEYTGKYMIASSTSGQKSYQPCPYSRPPVGMSWSPDNEGPFTTTAKDGTVYNCDDSRYLDHNVGDSKSCVTSMKSITQISTIYAAYTSSVESAASATSASEASVSASKASASAASASAASASAAAATPSGYAYITFFTAEGAGFGYQVLPSDSSDDPDICNIVPVATSDGGTYYDPPDTIDIDHGVLKGCTYKDDEIKCDDYTLPCKDFDGKKTDCGQARVQCGRDVKS
ncbi:hypothetical protein N7481_009333 [Penicillium waksmanii]|uniref:uncharacterized protein n=1 Tax=Penicillium waksmanii TaxID=69791 RepID=UPI0025482174|nr:uncharacterized protein N7481_009333 [Penicillium waksmanii]KAJ5975626.1 hypothetical protein N7481_009333 [Penicillium waksmanii]